MSTVTLIGIDLGKHSFHLHGQDGSGRMVFRKKLTRSQMFTPLGNTPQQLDALAKILLPPLGLCFA